MTHKPPVYTKKDKLLGRLPPDNSLVMAHGGECIVLGHDSTSGKTAVRWVEGQQIQLVLTEALEPVLTEQEKWVLKVFEVTPISHRHSPADVINMVYAALSDGRVPQVVRKVT